MKNQTDFDLTIGRLDRVLSKLVNWGRAAKSKNGDGIEFDLEARLIMDKPNQQTLKHHAEDMIAAGQKILRDLGEEIEGTPQPTCCESRKSDGDLSRRCSLDSGHAGPHQAGIWEWD